MSFPRRNEPSALLEQWQAFTHQPESKQSFQCLDPVVLQAWQRCRDLGIKPEQLSYVFLSPAQLQIKRLNNTHLIKAAYPYMQHLARCFENIPHVVALADAEGWIIEMSEQPQDALGGASTGVCLGSSWNEKHIGNNGIGTALATGEPTFVYGIEHYAMVYHSAYCIGVPIRLGGKIIGCLDVSVTREEEARPQNLALVQACVASIESTLNFEAQFRTQTSGLERFVALGSSLATTIHDLKNSLNIIRGMSQLGIKKLKGREEQQYFQKVLERSNAITGTIENLQTAQNPQRLISINPKMLLHEAIEDVVSLCTMQNISVEAAINACDFKILLQPNLFKRAIENLLSNAIKVMPEGGHLDVQAKAIGNSQFLITISDTGNGIPADIQSKIFDPFVSSSTSGTGLGLYMVYQTITETHNGSIWFETAPNIGTTFFITLPLDIQS